MNEPTGSSKDGLNEHGRHLMDGHQGLRVPLVKDSQGPNEEQAACRTAPQLSAEHTWATTCCEGVRPRAPVLPTFPSLLPP